MKSHRGSDLNALKTAKWLAELTGAELVAGKCSRLLVDLNRSEKNKNLFSEYSAGLPEESRQKILKKYYMPFRNQTEDIVENSLPVLHLSVHTFTPVLNGVARKADIGLLYDPARLSEKAIVDRLSMKLKKKGFDVRRNYPYRGKADGHTTALRKKYPDGEYAGIEIEWNQKLDWKAIRESVEIIAEEARRQSL